MVLIATFLKTNNFVGFFYEISFIFDNFTLFLRIYKKLH